MSQYLSRMYQRRLLATAAAIVSCSLVAVPSNAANRRAQDREARKACLSGDYTRGVAILSDLFVDSNDSTYIFNQGRCFEQNLRYREAIGRFEEYLRTGETMRVNPQDQAAAEKHIADCKARLAEEDAAKAAVAPPPAQAKAVIPPVLEVQKAELPARDVEQVQVQSESPRGRSGLLVGGIVTGAVGLAAVGAGIALNLKVNSMVSDMQTQLDGYTTSKNSSRSNYQTLMWVGYGVGAACLATGAILIAVGASSRRASADSNLALIPTIGAGQAGMLLSGGF